MRHEVKELQIPDSDAEPGAAQPIADLVDGAVLIAKDDAATIDLDIEVRVASFTAPPASDPIFDSGWLKLATGITDSGFYPLADQTTGAPLPWTHVRIYRTSVADGPVKAAVAGRNVRTT